MEISLQKFLKDKLRLIFLAFTVVIFCLLMAVFPSPAQAKIWHELDGNSEDVNPQLFGPVYDLGGGGKDVDRAIQWMVDKVRGCEDCSTTVDLVVIRSLTDDDQEDWDFEREKPDLEEDYLGYHELLTLQGVDSIATFVFSNPARQDANQPDIAEAIEQAEVVFFAGGDQCKYARNFKGTAIESAIESVQARGGAIGGTSAGAMIQGEWIFNSCSDTVTSDDALEDPYEDILFTGNLFQWPALQGTIVDTHFFQRDRMGRAMTFVARLLRDGITNQALAIGIDEGTSLVIDQEGMAEVMSNRTKGSVYFILGDRQPEVCEPETFLSFDDYKIWRVRDGETFDLQNIPSTDYYQVSVDRGRMFPGNPYCK
ncbi:MAG: Type 1 glutamine amidotransferase-like domain-containing protein [Xenococcus sp. MO_188.B8]|nr:Type 1 glutamine amidotransferase-like domain-containing protein [Xenococcus sp. MO_188.B8]